MEDISKEKQIEEMAGEIIDNFSCRMREARHIAKALYNAGYRKQEWISVDERLPDKEGTYLTYTDKDNVDLDIFCIYSSHGTKFWSGERRGKVTHWMPLPEAPKMKGGAE